MEVFADEIAEGLALEAVARVKRRATRIVNRENHHAGLVSGYDARRTTARLAFHPNRFAALPQARMSKVKVRV